MNQACCDGHLYKVKFQGLDFRGMGCFMFLEGVEAELTVLGVIGCFGFLEGVGPELPDSG